MKQFYLGTLVLLMLTLGKASFAQDFSNRGKDFWVAYGYHQVMNAGNLQEMVLYFASEQAANVTISIPGIGYTFSLAVPPNTIQVSPTLPKIPAGQDARLFSEGLSNKGIHITSDVPVVAYAHIYNSNVSGATILYPTNTLGKEYYSINYTNISNTSNSNCWFYVVAADTGSTTVEITPSANTVGGWIAGNTYTVTMTQGQVYNVMGQYFNPGNGVDLTGSRIRSVAAAGGGCKKIGVFSGSGRIAISCDGATPSSDNYMSQAMPKAAWGKKYLTTPIVSYPTNNGNTFSGSTNTFYRICVSNPATPVRLNGVPIALPLINNFYYQVNATTNPLLIEADSAIAVAQYFPSQGNFACGTNGNNNGDPEVIYLSPVEQGINKVIWNASARFQINPQKHYINAVIKNTGTAISSFTLDGVPVPATSFTPHPQDPSYFYARLNVSGVQGNPTLNSGVSHIVQSDSNFNAIAYGYGQTESYGYNAGTNIKDLYQFINIRNQYGTVNFPATCKNSPFRLSMVFPYQPIQIQWVFGAALNAMGMNDTTIFNGGLPLIADSSWVVNGRTLYQYRLPRLYTITAAGTYPIRVIAQNPTPDGCGNEQIIEFDVQVFEPPDAEFTFTNNGCLNDTVFFTDASNPNGRPVIVWHWDFGDGFTGNTQNAAHLYNAAGAYNVGHSLITDIGCLSDTAWHIVNLDSLPIANFTATTPGCINQPVSFTDQSTSSGTSVLQQWTWDFGDGSPPVVVIAPNPPNQTHVYTAAGTYYVTLRVETATGCESLLDSLQVVIEPDGTVNLTSAPGTDNQTVCINTPITNITYAVGGSSIGGSVSGLPAGVTWSFVGGVITISGTPTTTVGSPFTYTVSTSGPCVNPTTTGTITVTADGTVTLTSASGTDNQTVCINTPITSITYAVGGSSTGGSVSGLPAGVSWSFAGGVITISGTPTTTVGSPFTYTVSTSGPCVNPNTTGTITVTADGTLNLTSAPGTDNQAVCVNTAITNISYTIGGSGTGGSVSGLPPGVTWSISGNVITITGTPSTTVGSPFIYTVSTTGPCVTPGATGTITVNPDASITLTSAPSTANQELCVNDAIINITYAVGGTGTGANATGLPAGVSGVFAGGIFTISGTPTVSGVFNYSVIATGTCASDTATGTITVNALPTANFSNSTPSCESGLISFTDLSVPNSGVINGWTWNFGDGSPASNLQNPTHIYSTPGAYIVTLVVTTDKGCTSTVAQQTINIYAKPLAGFIVPEVCLNDTFAQFTDTSSVAAPDNITAWLWDFGDGSPTSTLQNPTHSYTATGSYTVRLIVTSNRGCRDTIDQNIFINGSFPTANFTLQNPSTLCANDSVSITEASTVFPGTITKVEIYWDNVGQPGVFDLDNFPVTGKIYKHLYPNLQTTVVYTIRYRAYSGGVCVDDTLRNITVNAAPLVQFNNMPDACLDAAPFQITQASEIGGVPGTGVFSGPGVTPGGIFNPSLVGPGTYTILYTFTSTAGGCVDTMSNTITVLQAPVADFSFGAPACETMALTFTDNSNPTVGTLTTWTWDFGDGTPIVVRNNGAPFPHTFATWGVFQVKLTVRTSNGCNSVVKTIPVTINPMPAPDFQLPAVSCLPNANVTFTNSSTIADGTPMSYSWDFGDGGTSTAQNPSHTYTTGGPFTVTLQVTSSNGCIQSISKTVNNIHPQPLGAFDVDKTDVCIGGSFTFTDRSNPVDGTTTQWSWTMGDGNVRTTPSFTYTYATPGRYDVSLQITNSWGCPSTVATKTVYTNAYPPVNAGPDKFVLEGGTVELTPAVNAGMPVTYSWAPTLYLNNPNISNPLVIDPQSDMTYVLTVTSDRGCSARDSVFVKLLKAPVIPNIFSPNGDGIHDRWIIAYLETYPGAIIEIYNRYGQLIFRSVGYSNPWDGTVNGKPVPVGTYYYIVNPKNGRKIMSGYVDVIR